jgi:NitT/TauT family transport system substrate-binding protein
MKKSSQDRPVQKTMFSVFTIVLILASVLSAATLLTACTPKAAGPNQVGKIRIAVLPIIDTLPFYVAQKEGLYAKHNIEVEFIPAGSAAERDQLIAAGQADGMINDLVSVALYNKQSVQVQTVRFAMVATSEIPMFRVLASKNSGFTSPADLNGVPIGMSQGTIIDYVTSRLLEKEGLPADQVTSVAVPKLSDRMALLSSGELKAATLPEPFGTMAIKDGAVLITDDSKHPEYGNDVISFRKAFIDQNPDGVKGFLAAFDEAAELINKDSSAYRSLLGENKLVPTPLIESYQVPVFPKAAVPSEAQWKDVVEWAKARQMIASDLAYKDSITNQYLK